MASLGGLFGGAIQPSITKEAYEELKWQNELMNTQMGIAAGNISGSQLANILVAQQPSTPVKELDTLYWRGGEATR